MKWRELWILGLKSWKRIAMPGIIFLAVSVFWFGNAVQNFKMIQAEKDQPCRVTASAEGGHMEPLAKLAQSDEVLGITEVYSIESEVSVLGYHGQWTLLGVDSDLIKADLSGGVWYPEETGMPWLVVNQAALRQLLDTNGKQIEKIDAVDWLSGSLLLTIGERTLTGKICGILVSDDENDSPAVYLSRSSAKALQRDSGMVSAPSFYWLELKNAGCEADIIQSLEAQGFSAVNENEEAQQNWMLMEQKITGQISLGSVSFFAAVCLLWIQIRFDTVVHQAEYERLHQMRLYRGDMTLPLNIIRVVWCSVIGCGLGVGLALIFPIFVKLSELI